MFVPQYKCLHADRSWTVVEFFAGMGGMRVAGDESGIPVRILAAYEISEICQKAYIHNFGSNEWRLKTIERLPIEELDKLHADMWLMSPPCQPFTRAGRRQDHEDNRTAGLLHLIDVLPRMRYPPQRLLLENVIGFERSECRRRLIAALAGLGWETLEFALDPEDFGLPNRRPRYYGLFRTTSATECGGLSPSTVDELLCRDGFKCRSAFHWRKAVDVLCDGDPPSLHSFRVAWPPPPLGDFLQTQVEIDEVETDLGCCLEVPQEVMRDRLAKEGRYDLHLRSDRTSACLTKVNGRLPRGFSPLVVIDEAEAGSLDQRPKMSAQGDGPGAATDHIWRPGVRVRYLSPTEQLRLLGFPASYLFPVGMSFRDRCSLLGNSLNVRVVAWLLRLLLSEKSEADGPLKVLLRNCEVARSTSATSHTELGTPSPYTARGWGPRERETLSGLHSDHSGHEARNGTTEAVMCVG